MAEGGGGARGRAPALLEAARARYESLHISDDVFGESGPDSGGNPFYSTSAASHSSSAASSDDEQERPGPARVADAPEPEEGEAGAVWSAALRDRRPPRFEGTGGKAAAGAGCAVRGPAPTCPRGRKRRQRPRRDPRSCIRGQAHLWGRALGAG